MTEQEQNKRAERHVGSFGKWEPKDDKELATVKAQVAEAVKAGKVPPEAYRAAFNEDPPTD